MEHFDTIHYSDETGQIFLTSSRNLTIAEVSNSEVEQFDLETPGCDIGSFNPSDHFRLFPPFKFHSNHNFTSETFVSDYTNKFDSVRFLPFWVVEELDNAGVVDFRKFRRQLEDRIRKNPMEAFQAMASMIL